MNLKSFIIVSVLIHIIGGIFIYFHYNPIAPKVVGTLEEEEEVLEEEKVLVEKSIKKNRESKFKLRPLKAQPKKTLDPIEKSPSPPAVSKTAVSKKISSPPKPPSEAKADAETPKLEKILEAKKSVEIPTNAKADLETPTEIKTTDETPVEIKAEATPQIPVEIKSASEIPKDAELIDSEEVPKDAELVEPSDSSSKDNQALKEAEQAQKALEKLEKEVVEEEKQSSDSKNAFKSFFDLKQKRGNPEIVYPKFARKANLQGKMIVNYYVTKEGLVEKINLKKSSGHSKLDNHVLRLLSRYEFLPNQESWIEHEVHFTLEGEEKEKGLRLRKK